MDNLIKVATQSVELASDYLLNYWQDKNEEIVSYNGKDIKLRQDFESEKIIINHLKKNSEYPILSEEDDSTTFEEIKNEKLYWIVDPIDGTFNFQRSIPLCCISVALWSDCGPIIGVINDFISGNKYQGIVDKYCVNNGKKNHLSSINTIHNAVICSGLPTNRNFSKNSLSRFVSYFKEFKKVRFIGSAALSLAWLSSGLVDVYAEEDIFFWDVAAGLALVKASGGNFFLKPSKKNPNSVNVIAVNDKISINIVRELFGFI